MGSIHEDARSHHLNLHPEQELMLKPFLVGFSITWAQRRRAYATDVDVFFLAPEGFITALFGFEHDIFLAYSRYDTLQPRMMQAIDQLMSDEPAKGRVDQTVFFLVAEDPAAQAWIETYSATNAQSRVPVIFERSKLVESRSDSWFVRNVIAKQLFSRDLFFQQLPINDDRLFFGRESIVA